MIKKIFLLTSILLSTNSMAMKRPLKVAVFGDSVTAGVFADEEIGNPSSNFYEDIREVVKKILYASIIGREITPENKETVEEFNYVAGDYKRPYYSFALGRTDYSLRAKARKKARC